MSQNDELVKWVFKHFVSETPELDFSQVIDFQDEVTERRQRVAQIPQERRVNVIDTVILDEPCAYVVDEFQDCADNFDLSYLDPVPSSPITGNLPTCKDTGVVAGHSRDAKYMNRHVDNEKPGHSRNANYMNEQRGSGAEQTTDDQPELEVCTKCPEHYHPWQVGNGMLRPRFQPLFTVEREATRIFKKFNMEGKYYSLNIPPPVRGSVGEHWLRALLNQVINYFKQDSNLGVRPGDYVGLQLSNPAYEEKPVYVALRRSDQLDADVIFEKMLSIFDSNKHFFLNGKLEVQFNLIKMPHGSGSGNRIKKQMGQTDEEFVMGRPSFIKYKNPRLEFPHDELCLPYAIVLGKTTIDRDKKKLTSLTRSVRKLREAALILCRDAGVTVPLGGCSIEEVPKFQAILPNYQIVIYTSLESKHRPYTDLDYYHEDRKINILLLENHYRAMTSLKACMATRYVCPDCHTRTRSRLQHRKCVYTCPSCLSRPPCTPLSDSAQIDCNDCSRSFRGAECYSNHLKVKDNENFSVCERVKRCSDCNTVYYVDKSKPHYCGVYYCCTCEEMKPIEHQCYMKLYKTKRCSEKNVLYVTYDFETQQNTLLDPSQPSKYKHLPNLCVVQTYCYTCQDEPDVSIPCVDCGDKQRILFSDDCVGDLLAFIAYKSNERQSLPEEEDEEGQRCKKRRKRRAPLKKFSKVIAISHNMGGFDGQFVCNYVLNSKRYPTPKIILNGTRIVLMSLGGNVSFIDSLNYFHKGLSALPEMFGLEEAKGYYPHFFNTPENAGKVCKLPDKKFYSPDSMSVKARKKFNEWYDAQPKNYIFDNDKELIEYCIQDVNILRKSCMKFQKDFWETSNIDPFLDACTIAGACSKVFRSNYLKPETIGILPTNGYRFRDNQSKIALKWLSLIEIREGIEIQHAARSVEKHIIGVGKVDGFHEPTNTVYEFMGCFYHGCERCYPNQYAYKKYKQPLAIHNDDGDSVPLYLNDLNASNDDDERNQLMFIRRENTERKNKRIREAGYNLVIMKECTFRRQLRQDQDADALLADWAILLNDPLNPRDAFYGGRTNATKLYFESDGITKMYYYDICSLYPFINKTAKCPIGHPEVHIGDICNMVPWQGMDGLIKLTITPPKKLYNPVLPVRMHSKLMFILCNACAKICNKDECGHTEEERAITGTWVIDEVKLALEHGYEIVKVHEIWEYEVTQYDPNTKEGGLFAGYIDRFLKMKASSSGWPKSCKTDADKDAYIKEFYEREGILLDKNEITRNNPLRELSKIQLNSFWGRFGIRADQIRTIIIDNYESLVMKMLDPNVELDSVIPVNDDYLLLSYKDHGEYRLPDKTASVIIAAFTTAYARMELYKYLDMLGPERIYYFDTDSVFFTAKPGDVMPQTGEFLGMMTDELEKDYGVGTYIIEFASGGPKNYAFRAYTPSTGETHTVVKVKGITLNYETSEIVNFDLIKELVMTVGKAKEQEEELEANVEASCSSNKKKKDSVEVELHSIRRTNKAEVYSTRVKKTYRVNYTKRKILKNYDTLPYGY